MAKKTKPNYTPFGNKKSGKPKSIVDVIFGPPSKKQTSRTHHDSRKGGGNNNTGKRR